MPDMLAMFSPLVTTVLVAICAAGSWSSVSTALSEPFSKLLVVDDTAALKADDQQLVSLEPELLSVTVLFRHGARAPLSDRYLAPVHGARATDRDGGRAGMPWAPQQPAGGCALSLQGPYLDLQSQPGLQPLSGPELQQIVSHLPAGAATSKRTATSKSTAARGGSTSSGGRNAAGANCSRGQLTRLGYEQGVALGSWLRQRYGAALTWQQRQEGGVQPPLPASAIEAHSSHVGRALLTLHGVLTGLQGNTSGSGSSSSSSSKDKLRRSTAGGASTGGRPSGAIPVYVAPEGRHTLYANTKHCARLAQLARLVDRSAQVLCDEDSKEAEEVVRRALQLPPLELTQPSTWLSWKKLLDAAMCAEAAAPAAAAAAGARSAAVRSAPGGRPLLPQDADRARVPPLLAGLGPQLYDLVDLQATRRVVSVLGPPCNGTGTCQQLLQLGIGLVLQQLLDDMTQTAAAHAALVQAAGVAGGTAHGGSGRKGGAGGLGGPRTSGKLRLFSGHDSTLMPIMAALGHPLERWPPFASNMVIELWAVPISAGATAAMAAHGGGNGGAAQQGASRSRSALGAEAAVTHGSAMVSRRAAASGGGSFAWMLQVEQVLVQEHQRRTGKGAQQRQQRPARGSRAGSGRGIGGRRSGSTNGANWMADDSGSGVDPERGGDAADFGSEPHTHTQGAAVGAQGGSGMGGAGTPSAFGAPICPPGAADCPGGSRTGVLPREVEYRVRVLYDFSPLVLAPPLEGPTTLPRLDQLAAMLAPYAITRAAYQVTCAHTADLVGLLERQIGAAAAATSRGHFFDHDNADTVSAAASSARKQGGRRR